MKQIILAIALIISFQSRGQITFVDNNTRWEELSKQAKEQDKLIFIHFENSECVQCNEVASMGFSKENLKEIFDDEFIAIRCNVATPNGRSLAQRFRIISSLMSLYVDSDGNILHVNNGSTGDSFTYKAGAELALSRKGKKQLKDYDKEYDSGVRDLAFLREYMVKKREGSMAIDQLLDEYVAALPADSLHNFQTIRTIFELSPSLGSEAYETVKRKTPQSLIDSVFRSAKPEDRKLIIEGIIENSFRIAIQERDGELAIQIAEFSKSTSEDASKGDIAYLKSMARYYHRIHDNRNYFEQATKLVDTYYMPMTIDSLNAMDDAALKARQNAVFAKRGKPEQGVTVRSFAFMPPSQFIHQGLNEHAYHFYELTRDEALLEKALEWSKKSLELSEDKGRQAHSQYKLGNPGYLDTYAHLLYKLGRKEEAIEWQTKAVEAQKVTGMAYESFEIPLNKMKAGTL